MGWNHGASTRDRNMSPSIHGTVVRLSAIAAAAKMPGEHSSPLPTAAKFIPPPTKAAVNIPLTFHVSGPTQGVKKTPAMTPPA